MKRPSSDNCIETYFHCATCFDQMPVDQSPSEWSDLEVGFTEIGLQVRCKRCDLNIVHIDFEGCQHPANADAAEVANENRH